jgi:hypothetical protein
MTRHRSMALIALVGSSLLGAVRAGGQRPGAMGGMGPSMMEMAHDSATRALAAGSASERSPSRMSRRSRRDHLHLS